MYSSFVLAILVVNAVSSFAAPIQFTRRSFNQGVEGTVVARAIIDVAGNPIEKREPNHAGIHSLVRKDEGINEVARGHQEKITVITSSVTAVVSKVEEEGGRVETNGISTSDTTITHVEQHTHGEHCSGKAKDSCPCKKKCTGSRKKGAWGKGRKQCGAPKVQRPKPSTHEPIIPVVGNNSTATGTGESGGSNSTIATPESPLSPLPSQNGVLDPTDPPAAAKNVPLSAPVPLENGSGDAKTGSPDAKP